MQQEYLIKIQMIQQEAQQLEQKMQMIDEQIIDMQSIKTSLADLKDKKKGDEMLSNLGKGIFVKTKLDDDKLFVNVGKEVMVKKTVAETEKVMEEQISKLMIGKQEIMARIEHLQEEMMKMVQEVQKDQGQESKKAAKKK